MRLFSSILLILLFTSCSTSRKVLSDVPGSSLDTLLAHPSLRTAHVGVSIFDPATGKYLVDHHGDKYFVPASNTKIPTLYAAMKYLGDSLEGVRYARPVDERVRHSWLLIQPTGDPTLLHPDFKEQPVWDLLQKELTATNRLLAIDLGGWRTERWGSGWSWNDYEAPYMAERSALPIYGNVLSIRPVPISKRIRDTAEYPYLKIYKKLFTTGDDYFDSLINTPHTGINRKVGDTSMPKYSLHRGIASNYFYLQPSDGAFKFADLPFFTANGYTAHDILSNRFGKRIISAFQIGLSNNFVLDKEGGDVYDLLFDSFTTILSRPLDSLLVPMMHRSDNFFAEQSLLMVSRKMFGYMQESKAIDSILKMDLADLPQRPRWVDGSGLSRYNLWTPQDFVALIGKMHREFGADRLKRIFATGNKGTLNNYYKSDSGYLYAKTGTLSGVVAISGFMYTAKGRLLYFSVLVNNHTGSATPVRRAVERFIQEVREERVKINE